VVAFPVVPMATAEPNDPPENAGKPPGDHGGSDAGNPPADGGAATPPPPEEPDAKKWYVVKVQSGREESIREAIERRVKIEGLQDQFGQIIIPVERVTEMSRGKRVVKERKLYPGYLMVHVEYNDRMLYLFRETSGVGDFVGASHDKNKENKPPPPMSDREVERLKNSQLGPQERTAQPDKAPFEKGDHVKVKDGTFAGMEGAVKDILEHKGAVVVELTIFGRPVPVELEYWQVDEA
jgi:transcription termination/antitermination protein NusG